MPLSWCMWDWDCERGSGPRGADDLWFHIGQFSLVWEAMATRCVLDRLRFRERYCMSEYEYAYDSTYLLPHTITIIRISLFSPLVTGAEQKHWLLLVGRFWSVHISSTFFLLSIFQLSFRNSRSNTLQTKALIKAKSLYCHVSFNNEWLNSAKNQCIQNG